MTFLSKIKPISRCTVHTRLFYHVLYIIMTSVTISGRKVLHFSLNSIQDFTIIYYQIIIKKITLPHFEVYLHCAYKSYAYATCMSYTFLEQNQLKKK